MKFKLKIYEKIQKYFILLKESSGIKCKIAVLLYPLTGIIYPPFLVDMTLKNKYGIFYSGKNFTSTCVGASFFESGLDEYLNLNKGVFVDIGAHIGRHSIPVAKRLNNNGKVISIEGNPEIFKMLKKNIELNKLNNILAINVVCYKKDGNLNFYITDMKHNDTGDSIIPTKHHTKKIVMKALKLDTILKSNNINKVDLIKIDVEGAEKEVLDGASKTIEKDHPMIIFEALNKKRLRKSIMVLEKFGYKVKKIDDINYFAYT